MGIRRHGETGETTGRTGGAAGYGERAGYWWRRNRSIRWYGLAALAGTKLADIVTTAVGVRYVPGIIEANPVADWLFAELGLYTGLALLGVVTVCFAAGVAELFGIEVRRRYGLEQTALFAQLSIYLTLSALFAAVAVHNGLLIADQAIQAVDATLLPPGVPGG